MAAKKKQNMGWDRTKGLYVRSLGWFYQAGKIKQPKFYLGSDLAEAEQRNQRLEQLWRCMRDVWNSRAALDVPANAEFLMAEQLAGWPKPTWDPIVLEAARALARGEDEYLVSRPDSMKESAYLGYVGRLNRDFPSVIFRPADAAAFAKGLEARVSKVQSDHRETNDLAQLVGIELPSDASQERLHSALDAYAKYVDEKNKDRPCNRPQQRAITLLKQHVEDVGLGKLEADRIETWLAYWCRRPTSKTSGRPLALTTCRNVLCVLRQFVRWLNRSRAYAWTMPIAFDFPRCKIAKLAPDRVKKRRHFTVSELTTLWRNARPWERALIVLALNCGFSKREIATLQHGEVVSGRHHTFIKRHRTKTEVYAEWVLWPETLKALECLKHFTKPDCAFVVSNSAGTPLTEGTRTGNENQVIKNHWDRLFKRIHMHNPEAYKLSFKHLRKTGAQLIRRMGVQNAAELSSMYLAHGERCDAGDQLLSAYTNRPWRKLHKALIRLRRRLLPVFTSVENPWTK